MRKHILLAEMLRLQQIILEDRMDQMRKMFLPRIKKGLAALHVPDNMKTDFERAEGETPEEKILNMVASFDPDEATKKNTQWMLNIILKGAMPIEDLDQARMYLKRFAEVRSRLQPDQRDINRYKSLPDLFAVLEPFEDKEIVSKRAEDRALEKKMLEQAKVIYNGPDYRVLIPLTQEASCYFGINTQWCTAATTARNHFPSYNARGPLYIILEKKTNTRWQFHPSSHEWKNEQNASIDIHKFLETHPVVAKVFSNLEDLSGEELIGEINTDKGVVYVWLLRDDTVATKAHMLFKLGRGLVSRTFLSIDGDCEGKGHPFVLFNISFRGQMPNVHPEQYIKFFNANHVTLFNDHIDIGSFMSMGVFYNNGKWGSISEVGEVFLKVGGYTWYNVENYYQLKDMFDVATVTENENAGLSVNPAADWNSDYDFALAELMIKLHVSIDNSQEFTDKNMDDEALAYLNEETPELLSFAARHKVEKDRTKLLGTIKNELNTMGVNWTGDIKKIHGETYVIEDEYRDIYEAARDNAQDTKTMDRYIEIIENGGETVYDYYDGDVDEYSKRDMLDTLKDETRQALGEYLASAHPDEAVEVEDYDPSSTDSIIELQELVRDDNLDSAFTRAYEAGRESGAYKAIKAAFMAEVTSCGYLIPGDGDEWGSFEGKILRVIPIADVIKALSVDDTRDDWAYHGHFHRDEQLTISEPYYGWDEFDSDSSNQTFRDEVAEFVKIS
jgi:hypothetical protein